MDLERHYPQNTISHCIISNDTPITLHFFQGRISAIPDIRTDLFLSNILNWNVLINFVKKVTVLLVWFPAGQGLKKVDFSSFFKVR